DGIRDFHVTGVQTCALPISLIASEPAQLLFGPKGFSIEGINRMQLAIGFSDRIKQPIAPGTGFLLKTVLHQNIKHQRRIAYPGRSEERRVGKDSSIGWQQYC